MAIVFKISTKKPDLIEMKLKQVAEGMNAKGGTTPRKGKAPIQLVFCHVVRKGDDIFYHMSYALPVPMNPVKKVLGNRLKQFKKSDAIIGIVIIVFFVWLVIFLISNYSPPKPEFIRNSSFCIKGICDPLI